jgi:GNAT superfamily N-acetyltransferase
VRRALTGTPSGIIGADAQAQTAPPPPSRAASEGEALPTRDGALVRSARPEDTSDVSALLAELGYPEAREGAAERLDELVAGCATGVLVCEVTGRVAAVAAYQVMTLLERPQPQCRVTALVVARRHRRKGLATALLMAIETVAVERGCVRLEVTTRPDRHAALELYLAAGFEERPHRLLKALPGP